MNQQIVTIEMPTQTAGDDADHDIAIPAPFACQVLGADFAPSTATAANGTNYASLLIEGNDGAGGSFSALSDALTTETTAMAVGTARAFANVKGIVPKGGLLRLAKTTTGTGAAVAGVVSVRVAAVV